MHNIKQSKHLIHKNNYPVLFFHTDPDLQTQMIY